MNVLAMVAPLVLVIIVATCGQYNSYIPVATRFQFQVLTISVSFLPDFNHAPGILGQKLFYRWEAVSTSRQKQHESLSADGQVVSRPNL